MNIRSVFVATAISLALLSQGAIAASQPSHNNKKSSSSKSATTSYRWVDNNGVTHYGDRVPPEYAAQGRSELNSQGVPMREFPRQLTTAEAAEAQKIAADEARRRQHDSFLLTTYSHVSDIERLRDERLALIDGQMEIARGSISNSDQRLAGLQTRMAGFRPYSDAPNARRMPDQLADELVRALKERHGLQTALDSREQQKNDLRAQFDGDIARYLQLTTRPASR